MTKIKICGLKAVDDIKFACEQGADFIGFVFFHRSPRNISIKKSEQLSKVVTEICKKVALTVDPTDEELKQIIDAMQPNYLQLHGNETVYRVQEIKQKFSLPIIKAIKISKKSDFELLAQYENYVDIPLFDAKPNSANSLPGGNGIAFDWELFKYWQHPKKEFMLSGGLNNKNIIDALTITKAPIVDVSSGVEISPGEKSQKMIKDFIETVRAAKIIA